ncbi:hypothetical protein ADU90_11765 [Clostridium botulinum]|uniref:Uncharacterized protein n=1 Tax=Clostridium botulinum C/D str. DC5 TaxID=1443128 RepID=A0A0A0IIY2_CLOBO|nr:hypothetical protein [Clostridium botulinum]KEI06224.1 hypothetical protein Z952_04280 [Clostridium botulinum C/D str. BKT75002]KEI08634.1 hypothetical protein Z954_01005 [Clostridium botulinum C/D str. BKT2873]KGM95410.1 hypothetical protein Z956_04885 [Clostridium botulinum D str. CCUG 7971]KGN00554.1 hypothetical protein Z955_03365 [Clostridium botulinum C/D str. DC5]KOC50276.1 hypothetical protein ADU88_03425 [Clostridium botulinum]
MNYVEIVNDVSASIRFEVDYLIKGQVIEEVTPYFAQNMIKRIEIPYDARSINVMVWVLLPNGHDKEFFKDAFGKSEQRCYIAKGTATSATCSKVSCSSLPSEDYIYAINKSDSPIYLESVYVIDKEAYKDTTSPIKIGRGGILVVPRNAGKIQLKIYMLDKNATGGSWDVIYKKSYSHPFKICLDVSGTLKKPVIKQVPCNQGDNNGPNPSEGCFCKCCCCCCCRCYNMICNPNQTMNN